MMKITNRHGEGEPRLATQDDERPGSVQRNWQSGGLALQARDYDAAAGPSRTPVICLHGLTRNSRDFTDLAAMIAGGGRRVLAVDVRGRGRSGWDPNPLNYHVFTYAWDVANLMDALAIRHAHFVGTSMGGLIVMALASLRPDLVAGAVLNDVGPEIGADGLARISAYVGQPLTVKSWDEAADYVNRQNAKAFPGYAREDWLRMARRLFVEDNQGVPSLDYDPAIAVLLRGAPGIPAPDLWPLWHTLSAGRPLLLLRGALSDLLEPSIVARMRDTAPHMAYAEIADVGHAPMLDEPEALSAINTFFDGQK
jgi:pimeloyl-ACP methyl ester carboxylesterase